MECGSKYESESADAEAAGEFLKTLDKLKVEENYLPEQICYMDDTPLLWKWKPGRTFIHKKAKSMPGFKDLKDRMIALLGGNAAGYPRKASVMTHRVLQSLQHISKCTRLVYYRDNEESCLLSLLTCYASEMETYHWRITHLSRFCLLLIITQTFFFYWPSLLSQQQSNISASRHYLIGPIHGSRSYGSF